MALALMAREEMIGIGGLEGRKETAVPPPLPKPCRMGQKMKLTS